MDRSAIVVCLLLAACGDDPTTSIVVEHARIIGRVESVDGVPLGKCQVRMDGYPASSRCDSAGAFDLARLPPGRVDLRFVTDLTKKPQATARIVAVAANAGYLTDVGPIRVAAGGAVGGRVKGMTSGTLAIIAVPQFGAVTAPNDGGAYLLKDVPPGIHDVVLTLDGGEVIKTNVEVKTKETTTNVDFDLSQAVKNKVKVIGFAARWDRGAGGHGDLEVELVEVVDGKTVQSTKTASDGGFTLEASSGLYQLRVKDSGNPNQAVVPNLLVFGSENIVLGFVIVVPPASGDLDGDGVADDKDDDIDGDGVLNADDAFPNDPGEDADTDKDGVGDNADLKSQNGVWIDNQWPTPDTDNDGKLDFEDNCPNLDNPSQTDSDKDGAGDGCDNCPYVPNKDQLDSLGDGVGDACRTCITGEDCTPANVCNQGKLSCPKGGAVCADLGVPAANGTPCGAGQVCNNGACAACVSGEACSPPTTPCNAGVVSCTTGLAVCKDTNIPAANGTPCGSGKVCNSGKCEACDDGGSCVPATLCKLGALDCSSGQPVCVASSTTAPDGTSCGTNLVCSAGACVACNEGGSCSPSANKCHAGTLSCATGTAVCVDTGANAPDGTACGVGLYCKAGTCTTLPNKLAIVSGDGQTGYAGAVLGPVVLKLTDGGGLPLAGEKVAFTAPAGGAVTPTSATTSTSGLVTVTPTLGPAVGAQGFTAQASSAPPATISATATSAPAGKSVTEVNMDHASGDSGIPGPAATARIGDPAGLAVASDGTLYFADTSKHKVRVVKPDGTIEDLAGTGAWGLAGDFGPASAAKLYYPDDVVLDEAAKRLYIADTTNDRVRVVDLSKTVPTIETYAGGGAAPAPAYGDGGLATAATLNGPSRLSIGPDKALYIGDTAHNRIRRVDPTTGVITTLISAASCASGDEVGLYSCSSSECAMAWNGQGALFIAAQLCGEAPGGAEPGILRRDKDGSLHHVAGRNNGVTADGSEARSSVLTPVRLALDSAGNLLFAEPSKHRVRRIDGATGLVSTVAGTGTAGVATEFSTAVSAPLDSPEAVAFDGQDLLISDTGNHSIRRVPGTDIATATAVTLAVSGGDQQSVSPCQLTPLPLAAKLTAAGSPLAGVVVTWTGAEPAVGLTGATATTASDGVALVSARPGMTTGDFKVDATFRDIHGGHLSGSPATFTIHAIAPSAGTLFTAVNVDGQTTGGVTAEQAATLAHLSTPMGLVVATDGTIYLSSNDHQVFKVTKRGAISVVAGTGAWGFVGDSGPALKAKLYYPAGLALDETLKRLFIADTTNNRVRMVDLTSGIITTYAGGGSAGAPGYGDGGPAVQASLNGPDQVAVDDNGGLYIADSGHHRVRKVDPQTKLISEVVTQGGCTGSIALYGCPGGMGCGVVSDGSGGVLVSGNICGTSVGTSYTPGIVRVSSTGAVTHVAGKSGGSSTDGTAATGYLFSEVRGLARSGSDLYVSQLTRVSKLSTTGGAVTTVAGGAAAGFSGDYGPATSALLKTVAGLAVTPDGHLLIADSGNHAVRLRW